MRLCYLRGSIVIKCFRFGIMLHLRCELLVKNIFLLEKKAIHDPIKDLFLFMLSCI